MRRCAGLATAGLRIAAPAIATAFLVGCATSGPEAGLAGELAAVPAPETTATDQAAVAAQERDSTRPAEAGTSAAAASTTSATSDSLALRETTDLTIDPSLDPAPTPTEPVQISVVSSPADTPASVISAREETAPDTDPKSFSGLTPPDPKPPPAQPPTPAARSARGEASDERAGETSYTWHDGDRTMTVWLQEDGPPPVFRSSAGALMTLPGGVILLLDGSWDQSRIDGFFAEQKIVRSRVTEQTFADNAFFVTTAPGFPSLELANALAGQDGVLISSPNWRREVEPR